MLKFKKNNVTYTVPHTTNKDGFTDLLAHKEGTTEYFTPALTPTETRYITQNSEPRDFFKFDSTLPTIKFKKNSSIFAVCNVKEVNAVYNTGNLSSITLSSIAYGNWSAWGNWHPISYPYWQRERTRTFAFTATVILTANNDRVINYSAYVKKIEIGSLINGRTYSGLKVENINQEFSGTLVKSIYVSGSGQDITQLQFRLYDKNNVMVDSVNVNCSINAWDAQQET